MGYFNLVFNKNDSIKKIFKKNFLHETIGLA